MLVFLPEFGIRCFSSLVFGLADIFIGKMCYIFKQMPCGSLNGMAVTVWNFGASWTKMLEDQINCRTLGLATHQEPWDWTSDVPLCQKTVWMLLGLLQWGVTMLPCELVLSCGGGLDYWDVTTQRLTIGKLDNLDQQMEILVEELRCCTIMRDKGYYFTREVDKYMVEAVWGPGRGHPGNKIPNTTMVSTVGLGIKRAFKGMLVEVNMGDLVVLKSFAEENKGLCQLGAGKVAGQWMQEKTEGCYKERYSRVDYMKIKMSFFSPPLM